MAELVFEVVH